MGRSLPPLNALKAFEAAARHGSFVRAAHELGVTSAAVSQQVRLLETHLERQLFRRMGNRLILSDAGQTILPALSDGFEKLAQITRLAKAQRPGRRIAISVLPSVAGKWLTRVLGEFLRRHEGYQIDLRVEEDPVEFERFRVDLRLCYGDHLYREMHSTRLCVDRMAPLCAPAFLEEHDAPSLASLLAERHLIHTDWGPAFASQPSWADWFQSAGIPQAPDPSAGHRASLSSTALDLAVAGVGVALGQLLLAQQDLDDGSLIRVSETSVALGHPYCLVHADSSMQREALADIVTWLTRFAGQGDDA